MSVELERDDAVVWLRLSRPDRRNALSIDDFARLHELLEEIAGTPSDRAVVITGAGKAFCAGADLSRGAAEEPTISLMRRINQTARALYRLPQPCVAAVNGPAVGAGMSLALGCDIVLAATAATFSQVFVKRGLSPDTGSAWLLPRIVGLHTAKRLALLGDTIKAEQALAMGIVTEVVADDELLATAARYARRLADGPPIALAQTKQLLNSSYGTDFDGNLDAEAAANAVNAGTADMAEAFAAFAEKRSPVFRGR